MASVVLAGSLALAVGLGQGQEDQVTDQEDQEVVRAADTGTQDKSNPHRQAACQVLLISLGTVSLRTFWSRTAPPAQPQPQPLRPKKSPSRSMPVADWTRTSLEGCINIWDIFVAARTERKFVRVNEQAQQMTTAPKTLNRVPLYVWVAVAVLALVAVVAGLARAAMPAGDKLTTGSTAALKRLVQQAARLATQIQQDASVTQQLMDANFGLAYINAARVFGVSGATLDTITGTNVQELEAALRVQQRAALDAIGTTAPALKLADTFGSTV